jgi:oligopeptide transport system ATP-binding protein
VSELLRVTDLRIAFDTVRGPLTAVDGIGFTMAAGAALGIVGESGSGKSQTALALVGLLADNARVAGSVVFDGRELLGLPQSELNRLRGSRIGFVFQDPMTALNPYLTIGMQMAEVLCQHRGASRAAALAESARMLDAMRIPAARERLRAYPHEFSGGMRQRVLIAMALLARPRLLIADEPTTALDVSVQAQILRLIGELRRDLGTALLLITHDLGVVAEVCEELFVMYAGRMVERGPTAAVLERPAHPYTRGLLRARPRLDVEGGRLVPIPGAPPQAGAPAIACAFAPRCEEAEALCTSQRPPVETLSPSRCSACFHAARLYAETAGLQ